MHQTLRFGDLPTGTKFHHPKTNEVYERTRNRVWKTSTYNATAITYETRPQDLLIHPDTIVTLTSSTDFFSVEYSAMFAYDQKVYRKIARNRARHGDITKHFEPSDSVSPV